MVKITIVLLGKLREPFFKDASEEYLSRLKRFVKIDVIELENERRLGRFLQEGKTFVIAMDEKGEELTSNDFAYMIKDLLLSDRNVCFIVGGWKGLDDEIKKRAGRVLSLSKMTFPYQLALVILLEQIYRAFTIIEGIDYHK